MFPPHVPKGTIDEGHQIGDQNHKGEGYKYADKGPQQSVTHDVMLLADTDAKCDSHHTPSAYCKTLSSRGGAGIDVQAGSEGQGSAQGTTLQAGCARGFCVDVNLVSGCAMMYSAWFRDAVSRV
jgi:hypothetical protein